MNNILITSAGRRVSLVRAFQKELTAVFADGRVFTADMRPELSSACYVSDASYVVPNANDPLYCETLLRICMDNNITVVIPTIDTELITLSNNRPLFEKENVNLILSSHEVVQMCRDKRKTHKYFDLINLDRPGEIDIANPVFPLFAKPFDGSSSIGSRLIINREQLEETASTNIKMIFVEYIRPEESTEYTIDMYFDRNHNLKCAVPRERLEVRSGEVSKSVTRRNELYGMVCKKFSFSQGFVGCITLQLFRNNNTGEVKGIEINPRFGGGYPLSYHANANYPQMIIREYLLNETLLFNDSWIENLLMLRYDDEIILHDYKY